MSLLHMVKPLDWIMGNYTSTRLKGVHGNNLYLDCKMKQTVNKIYDPREIIKVR